MEKEISTTDRKYYKQMLKLINCFLNLTDLEIELIANMFLYNITVLDKTTRNQLRQLLNKSEFSFNNYIKKLKDKNVLIQKQHGVIMSQSLIDIIESKEVNIKFNVLTEDE